MKTLVTGALGQLGSEIKMLVEDYSALEFVFANSRELDITDYALLKEYILNHKIKAVINCAAYTAVDAAEKDSEKANEVNFIGTQNLVQILEKTGGKLIHISTDYVFDGSNFKPYTEEDIVNPLGVYGASKFKGEDSLFSSKINGIVIRTSWLYSSFGNNFVKTMMRLGNERAELGIIFDQVGSPTYARDLAKVCLAILSQKETLNKNGKLYHFSNEGVASWYDFAKAIMEINEIDCHIKPIESKEYPTPAKRPHYSILNKNKIKKDFEVEIPYWRDS
jgi:dTDP-4-dehydrorhamnose reductase